MSGEEVEPLKVSAVGKKILIITGGSRGDIQPFMATAIPLMKYGMKVGIITNMEHEALVKSVAGIDYFSNGSNFEYFFTGQIPQLNPTIAIHMDSPEEFLKAYAGWRMFVTGKEYKTILETIDAYQPDALLVCGPCNDEATGWLARVTRIPVLQAALMPFHFCPWEAPSPGVKKLPCGMNMMHTKFFLNYRRDILIRSYAESVIAHTKDRMKPEDWWPKECEELIPWGHGTPEQRAKSDDVLVFTWADLHKKPTDPSTMIYTGYPFMSTADTSSNAETWGGEDTANLEAFFAAGATPAYIGYGSMCPDFPQKLTAKVVLAAKVAGCRAVILGGYSGLSFDKLTDPELKAYAEENIIFVKKADHATLFPKCSVGVHHAGHGTCLAAPRAGMPSVVTPTHLDQTQNGKMLQANGLGILLPHLSKCTGEMIGEALRKVIDDRAMKEKCEAAARMMAANDGQEAIGKYIVKWMETMALTGEQMKKVDAYWKDICEKEKAPKKPCGGCAIS